MASQSNEGLSFFAGLVIGGLFGAALALIMAPQSGEETRAQIRDRSLEYKDRAEEGLLEARHRATEASQKAQEKAQEQVTVLQEKSKAALEKGKQSVSNVVSTGNGGLGQEG